MTKEEIFGMITLSLKYKSPKSILLKFNLLRFCRLRGKILKSGSFLYSINFKKNIIPVSRIWNLLNSEVEGKTEIEFLDNLNKLIMKYHYSRYYLSQALYINPENGELKSYPMSDEERNYWLNINEEKI